MSETTAKDPLGLPRLLSWATVRPRILAVTAGATMLHVKWICGDYLSGCFV